MFFGKVKKVSCFINNTVHDYKSEDSAAAMLFFENGAIAIIYILSIEQGMLKNGCD
jgi:predicted dehydrogenase